MQSQPNTAILLALPFFVFQIRQQVLLFLYQKKKAVAVLGLISTYCSAQEKDLIFCQSIILGFILCGTMQINKTNPTNGYGQDAMLWLAFTWINAIPKQSLGERGKRYAAAT